MSFISSVHFSFYDICLGLNNEILSKVTGILVRSDMKSQRMIVSDSWLANTKEIDTIYK